MKKLVALFLVFAMIFSMAACGGDGGEQQTGDGESGYPSMTIKVGGTVPDEHPLSMGLYEFERLVEEGSDGAIQVEVYTNGQMGTGRELVEAVQLGNVEMCEVTLSAFASFSDEFSMLSMPFLFKNRETAYAFVDGEFAKTMSDNVANETGVTVMEYVENGIRQLTNSKKTVTAPADMKGLKIRVMESDVYLKMFEAMGASPMPMAFGELYTALQQKTIDGQDNPYTIVVTNKFYEIQPYMSDLSHTFDLTGYMANTEWLNGLDEATKALIVDAMAQAADYERNASIEAETANKQTIVDNGVELTELTDEQRAAFKDACQSVYEWFEAEGKPISDFGEFQEAVAAVEQ